MKPEMEDTTMNDVCAILTEQGLPGLPELLGKLLNCAMKLERQGALSAEPYERTEERKGYANGFKPKLLKTRVGAVPVEIPQVRGMSFYPQCLERGERSEKALKAALAQMYLQGVSTRKVTQILEALCGLEITSTQVSRVTAELDEEFKKWRNRPLGSFPYVFLDARYEKVRYAGCVRTLAILWAIGITPEGHREVLGVSVSLSEAEVHWRGFLKNLRDRGIKDIQLIISDDHAGLKAARVSLFGSIPWQRCQFHLAQNAQHYATSLDQRRELAQDLRDIFNAPDLTQARSRLTSTVAKYEVSSPKLSTWLDENVPEGFTVFAFPKVHQKRLRTSNIMERGNREIKRRTRVATLFPNEESCLWLISAVLIELHEAWVTGKRYLTMATDFQLERKEAA
jgi:transposase-like protein